MENIKLWYDFSDVLLMKIGVLADHFSSVGHSFGDEVFTGDDSVASRNIPVDIQFFGQAFGEFYVRNIHFPLGGTPSIFVCRCASQMVFTTVSYRAVFALNWGLFYGGIYQISVKNLDVRNSSPKLYFQTFIFYGTHPRYLGAQE